jgi:hypothetical protein
MLFPRRLWNLAEGWRKPLNVRLELSLSGLFLLPLESRSHVLGSVAISTMND